MELIKTILVSRLILKPKDMNSEIISHMQISNVDGYLKLEIVLAIIDTLLDMMVEMEEVL
jgi:hypothetical protein